MCPLSPAALVLEASKAGGARRMSSCIRPPQLLLAVSPSPIPPACDGRGAGWRSRGSLTDPELRAKLFTGSTALKSDYLVTELRLNASQASTASIPCFCSCTRIAPTSERKGDSYVVQRLRRGARTSFLIRQSLRTTNRALPHRSISNGHLCERAIDRLLHFHRPPFGS